MKGEAPRQPTAHGHSGCSAWQTCGQPTCRAEECRPYGRPPGKPEWLRRVEENEGHSGWRDGGLRTHGGNESGTPPKSDKIQRLMEALSEQVPGSGWPRRCGNSYLLIGTGLGVAKNEDHVRGGDTHARHRRTHPQYRRGADRKARQHGGSSGKQ